MKTETSNLAEWPIEILEQLYLATQKSIAEIRIDAINRDMILKDAYKSGDYSRKWIETVEAGKEKDKARLDSLIQAQCAVYGAMKVRV
jgi:hypothetical protein